MPKDTFSPVKGKSSSGFFSHGLAQKALECILLVLAVLCHARMEWRGPVRGGKPLQICLP